MKSAIALAIVLTAANASAGIFDECDHSAPRTVAAPAAGISKVVVVGKAGSLKVTGRAGVAEIRATGTACASDEDFLDKIRLTSRRDGSELRIEAEIPSSGPHFGFFHATLDFEVSLPAGMAVNISDGSGSLDVANTGSLDIVDGSGSIDINSVRGDVTVKDGSGSMTIQDVSGAVRVTDGSGSIEIRRAGSVIVDVDGSGSIDVNEVRGDFVVRSDGSGGVSYERVAGRVSIPRDDD
jgi:hypothetical protein